MLLFGADPMLAMAAIGAVVQVVGEWPRPRPFRIALSLFHVLTVMAAAFAASAVYQVVPASGLAWWVDRGLPIAIAVVPYCLVKCVSAQLIVPLATRQRINRNWPLDFVNGLPAYLAAAGIAAGLAAIVEHRMWDVAVVAAPILFFVHRAYEAHVARVGEERLRKEISQFIDQGMAVIDRHGVVTHWNDVLERLLECPRERALGHSVVDAMPALAKTELPRLITAALTEHTPQTLPQLTLPSATRVRRLQVRVLPVASGATLLWDDLSARTNQASARAAERLALAAEGASDGLWEWDSRTQEFYCSKRWRAMLGLPPRDGVGHVSEWFDRIHEEDRAKLKAALEAHLAGGSEHFEHTHRLRHEDGTYRRFLCRGVAARGPGRVLRLAGSLTEASEPVVISERAQGGGAADPLTGLGNRAVFVERLGQRLEDFKQRRNTKSFAALYLDLDRFKIVNDNLGHLVGDELLTIVSRRLEACVRPEDALARLGGDEFAILLNDLGDANQANTVAFRIQEALSAPCSIGGREVFTSASIGIALGNAQYSTPDEIMRDADRAMYQAKSRGKARHELFDADMHAREKDRLGLESDLRHAVNTSSGFEVHYQPIVLLDSGKCVGFESLARWTRNGVSVSPTSFIPLAEELGIIEPLGTWMLQQACLTFADWKRRFPEAGLDYVTVNVSSRQLMQRNFLRVVEKAIEESKIEPRDLRLEITETALMDSPNEAAQLLNELRELGTRIYLDDFGCGYSSLSHLAKLPVDALKIDRSFVKHLLLPDRPAIVESILALARTLKTGVVAEGIEHEAQGRELARLGCTHAQGFLYSRPLSAAGAEALIAANQPLGGAEGAVQPPTGEVAPAGARDTASAPIDWADALLSRP
ncbi:MAG TPA: EAL domain-containing protein [Vicinamibacterales bacterium]|nr:EAL domain-containing protein [Vicinamibacterales bacterium]